MKKILYCILTLIIIVSCSKDDDNHTSEPLDFTEQTLGKWRLTDRIPNGVEFCELKTTIEFKEENVLNAVVYAGDEPNGCDFVEVDGTWDYVVDDDGTIKMKIQINGGEATFFWFGFGTGINSISLTNVETDVTEIYGKVN